MKKRAPLIGGVLLFCLAIAFIYMGLSKSLPTSFKAFDSAKSVQSQTDMSSQDPAANKARDQETAVPPAEVKTSAPAVWAIVDVSPKRVQAWLKRLDEPFGFVKTAVPIKMDPQALVEGVLPPGISPKGHPMRRYLRLPLGNGEEVLAEQTRVDSHPGDMMTWVGEIPEAQFSDVFLTYNQGVWHGHVKWDDRTFEIAYGDGGVHLLREVNTDALPPDHPGDGKDLPSISEEEAQADEATHDGGVEAAGDEEIPEIVADAVVIRLLGAYNTDAKNKAGGKSAIEAQMGTGASQTTTAFSRGAVDAQMQLVHMVEYNYTQNTTSMSTDLGNFRGSSDGFMDNVHALRDQYKADMTILMLGRLPEEHVGSATFFVARQPLL